MRLLAPPPARSVCDLRAHTQRLAPQLERSAGQLASWVRARARAVSEQQQQQQQHLPGGEARAQQQQQQQLPGAGPRQAQAQQLHAEEQQQAPEAEADSPFSVVGFYHLVSVPNPAEVTEQHRAWLTAHGVRGRVYVSEQGINAQCSGAGGHAEAYARWTASQGPFRGLRWAAEPCRGHLFPKLRVKHRALVHLEGVEALPLTDPGARATALPPRDWRAGLAAAQRLAVQGDASSLAAGEEGPGPGPILLDVRNGYEWDAGHFRGASRPPEDAFKQTPAGPSDSQQQLPQELQGADPATPVYMYCTGGIRCDVYSTHLRRAGFSNLYTLEGGIQAYLREEGPAGWDGSLFVFDDRLAVPPDPEDETLPAAAGCQGCGAVPTLPHVNCANLDCNALALFCPACKVRWRGCCCEACERDAPRFLRPRVAGQQCFPPASTYGLTAFPRGRQRLHLQGPGGGALAAATRRPDLAGPTPRSRPQGLETSEAGEEARTAERVGQEGGGHGGRTGQSPGTTYQMRKQGREEVVGCL